MVHVRSVRTFCAVVVLAALAGCSHPPATSSASAGSADTSGANGGLDNGANSAGALAPGQVAPGSEADLQKNVGDRILFATDRVEISAEGQQILNRQAQWLRQYANVTVTIEGHCDERGTREYNLGLGNRRADAVKKALISLGIAANRIQTVSYGKERPAVVGSNEAAWAQNRRAVTVVN